MQLNASPSLSITQLTLLHVASVRIATFDKWEGLFRMKR